MKKSLFKVLLHNFLLVIIANTALYLLLLLVFNDDLDVRNEEIFIMSFAEIFGIVSFSILYQVSFFLPLYHLQKKFINEQKAHEIILRYMPIVSLIASLVALLVLLMGSSSRGIQSVAWINIWLIYGISYLGLIGFAYLAKPREE